MIKELDNKLLELGLPRLAERAALPADQAESVIASLEKITSKNTTKQLDAWREKMQCDKPAHA